MMMKNRTRQKNRTKKNDVRPETAGQGRIVGPLPPFRNVWLLNLTPDL